VSPTRQGGVDDWLHHIPGRLDSQEVGCGTPLTGVKLLSLPNGMNWEHPAPTEGTGGMKVWNRKIAMTG
jgi:hypothetical protein